MYLDAFRLRLNQRPSLNYCNALSMMKVSLPSHQVRDSVFDNLFEGLGIALDHHHLILQLFFAMKMGDWLSQPLKLFLKHLRIFHPCFDF
jgi:hypothetical protein